MPAFLLRVVFCFEMDLDRIVDDEVHELIEALHNPLDAQE